MSWREICSAEVAQRCKTEPDCTGMCDYNRCLRIQTRIDAACHNRKWEPGTPYVLDNPDGTICYCCCSCFTYDTPVAVNNTEFKAIQDFIKGDTVWAAGADLEWKAYTVDLSTGIGPESSEPFVVYVKYGSEQDLQEIIVTEDHLFLRSDKKLIPANALQPGDELVQPNGTPVPVKFIESGQFQGGVHTIATGPFTNSLDGHLLNSNGVVSADFAVQVGYVTGQLDRSFMIDDLDDRVPVGSEEYFQQFSVPEAKAFAGDPSLWPEGFRIYSRNNLIIIPPDAHGFFTDAQAIDIQDSKADKRSFTSDYAIEMMNYLFTLFKSFYPPPNPMYVLDWNNPLPNAYTFNSYGQDYVVVTGGLVRLYDLQQEGLALILAQALATLYGNRPDFPPELECVGPADYAAVSVVLGSIWRDVAFIQTFRRGLSQVERVFNWITPKNRAGNPHDKCCEPSIDCRLETFKAAAALEELPRCANPDLTKFAVSDVIPLSGEVTVEFSEKVNLATAETVDNYTLEPACKITSAQVNPDFDAQVILEAEIKRKVEYTLTISDVESQFNVPLEPNPTKVTFELK